MREVARALVLEVVGEERRLHAVAEVLRRVAAEGDGAQRVAFADAAKTGRLVREIGAAYSAVREVRAFAAEVGRIIR